VRSGTLEPAGVDRYDVTVAVFGKTDPVAVGRIEELGEARSQAEAALATYIAD
jgi:hypothetical protein